MFGTKGSKIYVDTRADVTTATCDRRQVLISSASVLSSSAEQALISSFGLVCVKHTLPTKHGRGWKQHEVVIANKVLAFLAFQAPERQTDALKFQAQNGISW